MCDVGCFMFDFFQFENVCLNCDFYDLSDTSDFNTGSNHFHKNHFNQINHSSDDCLSEL